MSDPQFEKNFADLAYAYLKDKAPKLLDYLAGFQVIDKNEQGTKAAGAFGFQVGEQGLLAPVFFINGALKGHDLLNIISSDSFVPLQENWVNYLIARKPQVFGEATPFTDKSLRDIEPDLSVFSESPLSTKYSSIMEGRGYWFTGAREFDIRPALRPFTILPSHPVFKEAAARCSLDRVFEKFGRTFAEPLAEWALADPGIRDALEKFYNPAALFRKAASIPLVFSSTSSEDSDGSVRVITADDDTAISNLDFTPAEQQKLLQDGEVYRDSRKNTSLVYKTHENRILGAPTASGVYSAVIKGGGVTDALVIAKTSPIGEGHSGVGVIINPETKAWTLACPKKMLVRTDKLVKEWDDFYKDLSSATLEAGGRYIVVGPGGEASLPFEVLRKERDGEKTRLLVHVSTYPVALRSDCGSSYESTAADGHVNHTAEPYELRNSGDSGSEKDYRYSSAHAVVIAPGVRKMSAVGASLLVPADYKVMKLSKESNLDFRPGTELDMTNYMYKSAGMRDLFVEPSGLGYQLHQNDYASGSLTRKEAMSRLVFGYRVHADTAYDMLESAQKKRAHFYIQEKKAFSVSPSDIDSVHSTSGFMGRPAERKVDRQLVVPELRSGSRSPMGQEEVGQVLQQAARTGAKEVFDTAALASLVKTFRSDALVDSLLGDLVLGLDRIGRILFLFYWHNDKFEKRHGQDEMRELEDSLINSFTGVGDLVLFLKKRVIDPDLVTRGSDVDLSAAE